MPTGTIIIKEDEPDRDDYVIIYARVSSSENKDNLDTQAESIQELKTDDQEA